MPLKFIKVGITARSDIVDAEQILKSILRTVQSCGAKTYLDRKRCKSSVFKNQPKFSSCREIDLLIVIGGDGTILRTVREMDDLNVPLLTINRGTVGFLAEMSLHEAKEMIPGFLSGRGHIEERSLLEITAKRGKRILWHGRVLNEAVASQGAISRLIDLKTSVNGDPLATFHADGLIIATPTGSTAYSLAAGGPIVNPRLNATILTPINPHSLYQKPIVLPAEYEIEVKILTKKNEYSDVFVSLTLDGQTYVTLERGDTLKASASPERVKFLRRTEETYFSTLRNKLKWGERLEEE